MSLDAKLVYLALREVAQAQQALTNAHAALLAGLADAEPPVDEKPRCKCGSDDLVTAVSGGGKVTMCRSCGEPVEG